MDNATKLKHVSQLIYTVSGWMHYDGGTVRNFLDEAKFKIAKIMGNKSPYIKEIDVFSNGKGGGGVITDWQDQILTTLNKMKFEIESEENNMEKREIVNIHCNNCNHGTNHAIISKKTEREFETVDISGHLCEMWTDHCLEVLKCGSCDQYSFRSYDIWCDNVPEDDPRTDICIWPKRGNSRFRLVKSFHKVPQHILSIYQETINACINDLNILCAGGIRALLDAICVDKGIKKGTVPTEGLTPAKTTESLKGKIYGLHENGFVTKRHSEILTHHQYLGDKALHELEKPSKSELEIAIEIIGDTLNSIYDFEYKAQELIERRINRN